MSLIIPCSSYILVHVAELRPWRVFQDISNIDFWKHLKPETTPNLGSKAFFCSVSRAFNSPMASASPSPAGFWTVARGMTWKVYLASTDPSTPTLVAYIHIHVFLYTVISVMCANYCLFTFFIAIHALLYMYAMCSKKRSKSVVRKGSNNSIIACACIVCLWLHALLVVIFTVLQYLCLSQIFDIVLSQQNSIVFWAKRAPFSGPFWSSLLKTWNPKGLWIILSGPKGRWYLLKMLEKMVTNLISSKGQVT